MDKVLIKRYIEYLNDALEYEEDPNEVNEIECKKNALLDILKEKNVYGAIEYLGLNCPDEEIVGDYECIGAQDGFSCYCCEECWKRILNI